jgi:hypothetical protein
LILRLIGLLLIIVGLALSYFGWREFNRIRDIEDEDEWADAVYGPGGEAGGFGMVFGAISIFAGIVMALRIF